MSKERNVEQYCEDYADEHGLPAVTDHQYAMRLKAENAELKEELRVGNHLLAVATDKQRDLDAEIVKLKAFIREFVSVECWGYIPEVDGGDVQEVAEKMGIIVPVKATQQQADDLNEEHGIDLEAGDTIYQWADWMMV